MDCHKAWDTIRHHHCEANLAETTDFELLWLLVFMFQFYFNLSPFFILSSTVSSPINLFSPFPLSSPSCLPLLRVQDVVGVLRC